MSNFMVRKAEEKDIPAIKKLQEDNYLTDIEHPL